MVECDTKEEMIVCLVLAFSIRKLKFPASGNGLIYFQLYIMKIDDGTRVPQKKVFNVQKDLA